MIEKDYIMRLIRQLTIALAKVLFNKEIKNYDQASREIDNSLNSMLGLDRNKISNMSEDEIFDYLDKLEGEQEEKHFVLAELLREEGEIAELSNKGDFIILFYYERALTFYLDAFQADSLGTEKNMLKLKFVAEKLLANDLYEERISLKWMRYFELIGMYAKAEDLLFHLLDDGAPDLQNIGREFYDRLLEKTDDQLKSGRLSREEILKSIQELEKFGETKVPS